MREPAKNIDEVIARLGEIIDWARRERSRLGYFAALYRNVTILVKEGIERGDFQNGPRMERLDVVFANRYLQAFDTYRSGGKPTQCWEIAFQAASSRRDLAVQHLLGGINAHINLDLGIACAEIAPGDHLPGLHADFLEINRIHGRMLGVVMREVESFSPWIRLLDHIGGRTEKAILFFSMDKARDFAWDFAKALAPEPESKRAPLIRHRDELVSVLAHGLFHPGRLIGLAVYLIHLRESHNVVHIIDTLAAPVLLERARALVNPSTSRPRST